MLHRTVLGIAMLAIAATTGTGEAWALAQNDSVPCYKISVQCTCSGAGGDTVSCTASGKHVNKQTATTNAKKNCTSGKACGSRDTPVKNCKAGGLVNNPDSPNATCRRGGGGGSSTSGAVDSLDIGDTGGSLF